MKKTFYENASLIFALSGFMLIIIQYILMTSGQNIYTERFIIIFSSVIQIGGGVLFGYLIKRLYILTNTDYLTGANNRKKFQEELDVQVQLNAKKNRELSLLMIDLDKFKSINDTYGHPDGDKVLIHIAEIFKEEIRNKDILARIGGEEFAIILPHTKIEDASRIAETIRDKVQNEIFPFEGEHLTVSCRIVKITKRIPLAI